jgi:hypothetical protein
MSNLKKWTQKDGTKIRIKDMSDRHLVNTVNMLIRKADMERRDALMCYPTFASEDSMASFYAEQEWDVLNWMTPFEFAEREWPIFNDLKAEIYKRQLEEKIN